MKKTIKESTVLFLSIIKWIFLATVAGAIVGGATALFLKLLAWATKIGQESSCVFLLLPLKD